MVRHGFDRYFLFSKPPEIRTVEGFSAVFAFVRCEHRLCSQSRRATNCATPGYGAPYAFLAVGFTIITQNWEVRKSILPQNYLLNLKCWVNFAIIIGESAKVHQLKTKKGEIIMLSGILEHVAKILGWTNDGYEQNIILAIAQWLGNKGL